MNETGKSQKWYTTLPAILGGIAAVLTAVTGLYVAINNNNNNHNNNDEPQKETPKKVEEPENNDSLITNITFIPITDFSVLSNTPSNPDTPYQLSLDANNKVHRNILSNERSLTWVIQKDGDITQERNAVNETSYKYYVNTKGTYQIWLNKYNSDIGGYEKVSNTVSYQIK